MKSSNLLWAYIAYSMYFILYFTFAISINDELRIFEYKCLKAVLKLSKVPG